MATDAQPLTDVEVNSLSNAELHDHLASLEGELRRVQAAMAAAVGEVDARGAYGDDHHRSMRGYLKATLNVSGGAASQMTADAKLCRQHPMFAAAWADGDLGLSQVAEFRRIARNPRLGDVLDDEWVSTLIGYGSNLLHREFRQVVDRFIQLGDHDGAHDERDRTVKHRDAHVHTVGSELNIRAAGGDPITANELEQIFAAFVNDEYQADVAARGALPGDGAAQFELAREPHQRRFDALVAIFRTAYQHRHNKTGESVAQLGVNVLIDESTFNHLLGAAGLANPPEGDLLGEATAIGKRRLCTGDGTPLVADDVLRNLLTCHVRRAVVDAAGVVIDLGRKQRLFTGAAREAAMLLTTGCEHPGCDLPAAYCQVDHQEEWADGGRTDQRNAVILCGAHNRSKHRERWWLPRTRDRAGGRRKRCADGSISTPVGAEPPVFFDETTDPEYHQLIQARLAQLPRLSRSS